ncbi:MAG: VIT and vWA domain-containing protein [Candidatus Polarisedimenticolia bacterium]
MTMMPGTGRGWWIAGCCLVFVMAAGPAGAQEEAGALSPYFLIEQGDGSVESFPLKSTQTRVNINGVIADVVVTQTYANEGLVPIHARYVFPGSTRSAVHGMSITVDDERVVATIKERQAARREFKEAKAQGKSASLLEQHRPNVFSMQVANIMPKDRVEVELRYTELLVPEEGVYEFVYPTVAGPRYDGKRSERWAANPHLASSSAPAPPTFGIEVALSTGLPLQDVVCSSHIVDIHFESPALARVAIQDPAGAPADRDFVLRYRLAGDEIQSGLLLQEGRDENVFLLMVQPPARPETADIVPREYIFVLDVSGSMDGFPLDTAKLLMRGLVGRLRGTDLFNVVLFAGGSRVMAPTSVPASRDAVERALAVIDGQRGGGGTELVPALKNALAIPGEEGYARTIVVVTDGYISAEKEALGLIQKSLGQANVFCFGIGSAVNRHLVEGLARAGRGEPFVVTGPDEAREAAERFGRYIESPVLTQVSVSFKGLDVYDVEPEALPDLFARRPILVFGKWRGGRTGEIDVAGMQPSGPYTRAFRITETPALEENTALGRLWARERIARLSDLNGLGEDLDTVTRVRDLGLTYSLLTPYTSFIAVLERVRNHDGEAAQANQPLALPQGVSPLAAEGGYAMGPEPELWILGLMAAAMVSILAWRRS